MTKTLSRGVVEPLGRGVAASRRHALVLPLLLVFPLLAGPVEEWGVFERAVRDQSVSRDSAQRWMAALWPTIVALTADVAADSEASWRFPLEGYGPDDVGRGGFQPDIVYGSSPVRGYNFYDGNRHGGHPAYDIFVRDGDHDCRDDVSGKPVAVVAPLRLLVLSADTGWHKGSALRGGNCVWAFAPGQGLLLYFAHLDSVTVGPLSLLEPGQTLGTVGRSGRNAEPKRSPTHLHMMVLRVEGTRFAPEDFLKMLRR